MHVNAAFETLAQIRLFYASLNTKNDSRFHSGNFVKVSYELIDYIISLTCVFVYSCRICTVIIYVQNGFSVGSYSLKCSYFS